MAERVTLYSWPESQVCLECAHSVGVIPTTMEMDERLGASASICMLNYDKGLGSSCLKVKKK